MFINSKVKYQTALLQLSMVWLIFILRVKYIPKMKLSNRDIFVGTLIFLAICWFVQVGLGHFLLEGNRPNMAHHLTFNSIALSVLLAWDYSSTCVCSS
jgi:hypothetical protein